MKAKILPYKKGSKSAKALAAALNIKQLKLEGSKWKPRPGSIVINWGTSSTDHPVFQYEVRVINHPNNVAVAANKLSSFNKFKDAGVKTPLWTVDRKVVEEWLDVGSIVMCRTKLNGHSGEGIVVASNIEELVDAPLYTKYVAKENEYRIHVIDNKAVFIQRKARVLEVPDEKVNWQIRNLAGGFIYANQNVVAPEGAEDIAIHAVSALGLHFGAVDIIKTKSGGLFVLEVNTACGLAGTTLKVYEENLKDLIENRRI